MVNEINFDYGTTGVTMYALILDDTGKIYNGITFETIAVANWLNYDVTMTEQSTSGIYQGTFPAIAAGVYDVSIRLQVGGAPVSTDLAIGAGETSWGGSGFVVYVTGNKIYASLQQFKDYHSVKAGSVSATDDGVINLMLESASRTIDQQTARIFYTHDDTKYFDTPRKHSSLLIFDEDVYSIISVINGNGATFAATDWVLYPYSGPPYDALGLVDNPSMVWLPTSTGNIQKAISTPGIFGIAPCPIDITDACLMIVIQEYHRRYGEKAGSDSIVLPSGMVISPGQMPKLIEMILANHRKIGMA